MVVTDSAQGEGLQNANSANSAPADKLNSFDPAEFAKTLKADILSAIKDDPRAIQSQKDRVIAEIKKDKSMREYFAEFKKMQDEGLSDAEVQRELRIRELEARLSDPATPAQSPRQAVTPDANDTVSALLPALGLSANDPEVTGVLLVGGDLSEQIKALAGIAAKKKTPPNPASVIQPSGGAAPQGNLMDEYRKAAAGVRGNALIELKMEYRKRGLDVS